MTAHRANAHADRVDRDRRIRAAEDLVRFRAAFPFFLAHPVAQVLGDPRDQAARQRNADVRCREAVVAQDARHLAVDVEDRRLRIVEQALRREMRLAHLLQELAHVLRARARCGLVGHARHPLDQVALEEAGERHHHETDRAIAADVIPDALCERGVDDVAVDGVENDDRIGRHPQRRSSSRSSRRREAAGRPRWCTRRPGK